LTVTADEKIMVNLGVTQQSSTALIASKKGIGGATTKSEPAARQ
jgi:C4-dicarboxylate transporter